MKNKQLFAPVWRHWKHAFFKYRWYIAGTTLAYGTTTYLDSVYKATIWKKIIDMIGAHHNPLQLFFLIPLTGVICWFINRFGDYCFTVSESNIIRYLKDYAMEHLLTYDTNFFLNSFSGSIVAKTKRFAGNSEAVYDEFAFVVLRVVVILSGIFFVAMSTIPIVGFVLLGWAILFGCISWYLSYLRTPHDLASADADSYTTGHLSDIIGSVHMVHSYTREYQEYENFTVTTSTENSKRFRAWIHSKRQWAIQAILVLILETFLMYIIINQAVAGMISVGVVVLVQSYTASVASYMWAFGRSITKVRNALADAHELAELLSEKQDDKDTHPVPTKTLEDLSSCDILFSNVRFMYPERNVSVLKDFTVLLEAGRRYGIIGTTGAGKTTLTRLLLRQFELQKDWGQISIGGVSIAELSKNELRSLISYVPQDPNFPFRSVREIIAFGKPDATDEEIIHASKQASCHDFIIEQLESGYDTKVGERGVKLSGGQRQRLAIAAAFLKDAPIIILDEPTSALDSETAGAIQRVLKNMKNKTLIVIAHRLSTIVNLDEIIVLNEGMVEEKGKHSVLLEHDGMYADFWRKEFEIEIVHD